MTKVKICGITNLQDAKDAVQSGAHYLGFIFAEESPRYIAPEVAMPIIRELSGQVRTVGVFRNGSLEFVEHIVRRAGVDFVQLHGSESPDFCRAVQLPIIKVVEIENKMSVDELAKKIASYSGCAQHLLFDRPKDYPLASWLEAAVKHLRAQSGLSDYFFAGGLTAQNVGVVLEQIKPFAVDVASGTECAPGKKDRDKMIQFCSAVQKHCDLNNGVVPK